MTSSGENESIERIAIIGMSGRFPGAKNVEQFWLNLRNGVESISTFSASDLIAEGLDPAMLKYPGFINRGGILEDIELFDASFFGYNPREAEITDPQQRLFLECAWEALESAGYNPEAYAGLIGVYAGVAMSKYMYNIFANQQLMAMMGAFQVMLGNDKDHLTTRVAYKLNLRGPAVTVQTTCSTSLVAIVIACQSLLNYQCDMALAGGASIDVPQHSGGVYQEGGISAPDGHCRAFDARAQGTVGGNGIGVVLLKRYSEAIADGDTIRAVIKGVAINNDGSVKVGYTAPSIAGQAEVIAMAQAMAGVSPDSITYIEAHGTGTPLGDPIEMAALMQVFQVSSARKNFCGVGSVKTNIGHLDPAAGVASLIKTVLALENKMLPPSLHFERPNPKIDFANSPFYVITRLKEWDTNGKPRRAGVSSFGIGGTNAHVVLEEAPAIEPSPTARPWQLLAFSARSSNALETATANLASYLQQTPDLNLADVAYTCATGRKAFNHRRVILCRDREDALAALKGSDSRQAITSAIQQAGQKQVVFLFSGQGAQHVNMAAELYQVEPAFRSQIDLCADLLRPQLGLDLRQILYPGAEQAEQAAIQLGQTAITQPALFSVEYALARLLMEWGLQPAAMIGHSIGEYVAACLAGVFSLQEALALVAERGKLMQQMPAGAMLAVGLTEQEVQPLLGQDLSLAAVNAPAQCVVSGSTEAVERLAAQLTARGVFCSRLHTSHAFHSAIMEPIVVPFAEMVGSFTLRPPEIPYLSNFTGAWITAEEATDPGYWALHLRNTVRFAEGVQHLLQRPDWILLEVGPGQTLAALARQQTDRLSDRLVLASMRHPKDQGSDFYTLMSAVGRLWLEGAPIDWQGFYRQERRYRIPLPTYPFERQRYWVGPPRPAVDGAKPQPAPQAEANISRWFYVPSWKRTEALAPVSAAPAGGGSPWLILSDNQGVGSALVQRLLHERQEATVVLIGDGFAQLEEGLYTIHPARREDYDALLKDLRAQGKAPETIVHLWSLTPGEPPGSEVDIFEACQETGYYSLLFLIQALGKHVITHPIQIGIVTNQLQSTPGDEASRPEKATLLGLCKVIPQEYPHITCRSIDVVADAPGGAAEVRLVDHLIAELVQKPTDFVVAYRGEDRWVQNYEAVELGEALEATPRLRKKGVYLITGGLGGIGLILAEHLARTEQARLVLVQRSPIPEKSTWSQWLDTHSAADATSQKIKKLQAIEKLGGEITVANADVADLAQMRSAIQLATEQFGALHGVVHAAGVIGPNAVRGIQEMDRAASESHFRPKAHGLYVLQQTLQGRELDFCLLFSSLSAVLGGLGFGAYAAANAFMDSFAYIHHDAQSAPWISVNWDGWQLDETAQPNAPAGIASAERPIWPQEGVRAFRRALSLAPQVVVATGDLQARIDKWVKLDSVREKSDARDGGLQPQHARPNLPTIYVAPGSEKEKYICSVWEELLGIEKVGINDNFFELGGHSLLAIQVISRLRDGLQVDLSVQTLFDHPTVADFAGALAQDSFVTEEDKDKLVELLELVEHLSEDEVRQLLEESGDFLQEGE